MSVALDSSILIEAFLPKSPDFAACCALIDEPDCSVHIHALNDTFATLTGGSLKFRLHTDAAVQLIRERIVSRVKFVVLDADDLLAAQSQARGRGVRGGAIYDFMHLVAARKAGADALCTLNTSDFVSFHRPGDPEIRRP